MGRLDNYQAIACSFVQQDALGTIQLQKKSMAEARESGGRALAGYEY